MSDWKEVVRAVAPGLAGVLGGPLASAAVSVLSESLLGRPDGTEKEIAEAVLSGGTEVLQPIKAAESSLKAKLAEVGLKLEEVAAQDRANARGRDIALGGDPMVRWLAVLYTIAYFATLYLLWKEGLPETAPKELFYTLMGVLTGAQTAILNYYFGSSHGSSSKTQILDRLVNHKD